MLGKIISLFYTGQSRGAWNVAILLLPLLLFVLLHLLQVFQHLFRIGTPLVVDRAGT